jgi:hypothetical protein
LTEKGSIHKHKLNNRRTPLNTRKTAVADWDIFAEFNTSQIKTNLSYLHERLNSFNFSTHMQDYSVWYQKHGGTPKDQKLLPQTP